MISLRVGGKMVPFMIIALVITGTLITGSITVLVSNFSESTVIAAEKQSLLNQKGTEDLKVFVENGILYIENNGPEVIKIDEIRLADDKLLENMTLRKIYQKDQADGHTLGNVLYTFSQNITRIISQDSVSLKSEELEDQSLSNKYGSVITNLGNEFFIENRDIRTDSNDSVLFHGIPAYGSIDNIDSNGKVFFGNRDNLASGTQTDIRQYVGIRDNDGYAVIITDNDEFKTVTVSDFKAEYDYINGELLESGNSTNFKVNDIESNMIYEISKDGITKFIGITSSDKKINIPSHYIDYEIESSPSVILKIYSDPSVKNTNITGGILMDIFNRNTIAFPITNLVFIPQSYIKWNFPTDTSIDAVSIDNSTLDYLKGNYSENKPIMIPVIPGSEKLNVIINGTNLTVQMDDISTNTQLKLVSKQSSTSSDYNIDDTSHATSNIATSTFLIASNDGTMKTIIDLNVGGSAEYTMQPNQNFDDISDSCKFLELENDFKQCNNREYTDYIITEEASENSEEKVKTQLKDNYLLQEYNITNGNTECELLPEYPSNYLEFTLKQRCNLAQAYADSFTYAIERSFYKKHISKLIAVVDVYKNMDYIRTESIYSTESGFIDIYIGTKFLNAEYTYPSQAKIDFPMTNIQATIEEPVNEGDMIEFIVRVNLFANGAKTPASNIASSSSYATVTTEFGGGSIISGMN